MWTRGPIESHNQRCGNRTDKIETFYDEKDVPKDVTTFPRPLPNEKMRRALEEFIVEGVKTTIPFHQRLMNDEVFQSGEYSTKYLEESDIMK